jgi:hypothetical protein
MPPVPFHMPAQMQRALVLALLLVVLLWWWQTRTRCSQTGAHRQLV